MAVGTHGGTAAGIRRCPACGAAAPPGESFCLECGSSLDAAPAARAHPHAAAAQHTAPQAAAAVTNPAPTPASHEQPAVAGPACPKCGRPTRQGARFCPSCGQALSPGALHIGLVLGGRYRITGMIGGGGMGAVYRGVDTNLPTREEPEGRSCAIKAILDTSDPELLAAAALEREMLIRLDHPNIVRIYDIITVNNVPFIVMALVRGTGWKQLIEQTSGAFAPADAVELILGVLPAFTYLQHRTPPVVYRDFKPGNAIQVRDDDGVRQVLIDLGTAVEYVPGQPVQAWGTPGYAPPEIRGVCEQTPAMDVYSLVTTLAEMVGLDIDAYRGGGVPTREQWPLPPELYDLLARGRSVDPTARFETVDEFREQLEGVARFIAGAPAVSGRSRADMAVPLRSRLFTGSIGHRTTARIMALPTANLADPVAPLLEQARALIAAGRYTQALATADAALGVSPSSNDAHLVKAAALTNLGRNEESRVELAAADRTTTPATRWRTAIVEAQAASAAGDIAGAERLYGELMRLVPGEVLPKQALADLYKDTSRYQQALDLYTRVVQADPANAEAVLGMADTLVALGRPDQAVIVLDQVSENAVRFVDAQLRLVELYLDRAPQQPDDLDKAGAAILALGGRAQSGRFFRLLGDWWYIAYTIFRAQRSLPAIDHWPDGEQHTSIGRGLLAGRAREAYRHYLRQEPDAPDANEVLERVYFGVDEWL
jgi:serine/threonine-protein kinase PknG